MKKTLLSLALCVLLGTIAGYAQNPLQARYYIYGEQTVTGRNSANLSNIQLKGFSCDEGVPGEDTLGYRNSNEKMEYVFNRIATYPEINIEDKELLYWRKLENGVWMSDAESGNATSRKRLDKDACMLLVLDCSKSLGNDFGEVKEGAEAFIEEMYKASGDGNIRMGIIYFSKMDDTKTFDIRELTAKNKTEMISFIRNQYNDNKATSMYYALNKGIDALDSYVSEMNVGADKYEGTHVVIFTDGLDNTSQIEDQNLFTANKVESYVKNKLHSTLINNSRIDSWVVGVQGDDVKDAQLSLMKSKLQTLASSNSQFIFLEDKSKLVSTFSDIAKNMTDRWKVLTCISSLNHNGPVCWTLDAPMVVTPAPKKTRKQMLLGLNVGLGMGYENDYYDYYDYYDYEGVSCLKLTAGLDFAYPITSKFGLGAYTSIGFVNGPDSGYLNLSVGALATIGDYNEKKVKFLVGAGGNICCGINADLRFGILFKKGLYLMTDIATGVDDPFAMTLNVGYNFGSLFK